MDFSWGTDLESVRQPPGEYPPREVIDHGVEVGARSVEETNDRGIDVPDLIGLRGPDPDLRAVGMHSESRPAPAPRSHELRPSRGRGVDATKSLSEYRQSPGRDVPVVGRGEPPCR